MTDRYAVVGNPIAHSKSPQIHAQFAQATGADLTYEAVLSPLDGFPACIRGLQAAGYAGVNVTVPFKHEAYRLATVSTIRATRAGAANTLRFDAAGISADNTDGPGLVRDITVNLQRPLQSARLLLMGAGGAAAGVLGPLLDECPAEIVIANRTLARAQELAGRFSSGSANITACSYEALADRRFDVLINATAAGLSDAMPPLPLNWDLGRALAYDMVYGRETPFMAYARTRGAVVADGLGMLVEQAAEAFFFWRGMRPDTAPVIARMRAG